MTSAIMTFVHRLEIGRADAPPILLLHGTGGDEQSLLGFGHAVAPGHTLISPRGKVLEQGANRFFRRFAEGLLDEEDLRYRASELLQFLEAVRHQNALPAPVAVGFSNGANIATAMLLLDPAAFAGVALLRPMVPYRDMPKVDLGGKPVLVASGVQDAIISTPDVEHLVGFLTEIGGSIEHRNLPTGHNLSESDEDCVAQWITDTFS